MGQDRDYEAELQYASLADEVRLLGGAAVDSSLYASRGVIASVVPSAPRQSIANTVAYASPHDCVPLLNDVAQAYKRTHITAWRVWVPEWHRDVAAALRRNAYIRTSKLPAISIQLASFDPPDLSGFYYDEECDIATLGKVNEIAHSSGEGLAAAFSRAPQGLNLRVYRTRVGDQTAAVVAAMYHQGPRGRDCGLYFAATVPAFRKRGLGTRLIAAAMLDAQAAGCVTASGQASVMGAPVWGAMGFKTAFLFETYEPTSGDPADDPNADAPTGQAASESV